MMLCQIARMPGGDAGETGDQPQTGQAMAVAGAVDRPEDGSVDAIGSGRGVVRRDVGYWHLVSFVGGRGEGGDPCHLRAS